MGEKSRLPSAVASTQPKGFAFWLKEIALLYPVGPHTASVRSRIQLVSLADSVERSITIGSGKLCIQVWLRLPLSVSITRV